MQRKGSAEFGVVARRLDARRGVGEGRGRTLRIQGKVL